MLAVQVVLVLLVAGALAQKDVCSPNSDENCDHLNEEPTTEQQAEFDRVGPTAEATLRSTPVGTSNVAAELDDNCPADALSDRPVPQRKKRLAITAQVHLGKYCEPCTPRVHYLRTFFRYCFVVYPTRQWVRYVTCPKQCAQPCWCSNSRCVRNRWIRVYFWSYCTRQVGFGFRQGLNYRWLWLPQDCTCNELTFAKIITGT